MYTCSMAQLTSSEMGPLLKNSPFKSLRCITLCVISVTDMVKNVRDERVCGTETSASIVHFSMLQSHDHPMYVVQLNHANMACSTDRWNIWMNLGSAILSAAYYKTGGALCPPSTYRAITLQRAKLSPQHWQFSFEFPVHFYTIFVTPGGMVPKLRQFLYMHVGPKKAQNVIRLRQSWLYSLVDYITHYHCAMWRSRDPRPTKGGR